MGIAFFGTPHSLEVAAQIGCFKILVENLQVLEELSGLFREQLENFNFISFYGDKDEVGDPIFTTTRIA